MSESTQSTSNMGDNGDSRGACDENGDNSVPTDVGSFAGVESGRVPVPNGRHASEQSDGDAALDDVENASRLQLEYEGVDEGGDVDVDGLVDEFGWMDTGDGVAAYHGPLTSRIVVDGLEGDAGVSGGGACYVPMSVARVILSRFRVFTPFHVCVWCRIMA